MSVMTTPHKPERLKYKSSLVIFFLYNEVIHSRAALGTQNIFFTFHSLLCTLNFKKINIKSKKCRVKSSKVFYYRTIVTVPCLGPS